MLSYEHIHTLAQQEGFSLCGVARARVLGEQRPRLGDWVANGYDGGLGYVTRAVDILPDPSALVSGAKTVVVCAVHYKNEAWDQTARGVSPRIASYSYAPDYHKTIKKMLVRLLKRLQEAHPELGGRCFTDAVPMLEKAWAVEAGLGWIGRNSLLVTPQYGSFVLLGDIVLDMECDRYDAPFEGERCGNCTACIDNCPAVAIRAPRVVDASRCISRLTIERMDGEADPARLNGWLFGCDECQSCCPYNAKAPFFSNPAFAPVIDPAQTTPEFWRSLTEEQLHELFARTPLRRSLGNILARVK